MRLLLIAGLLCLVLGCADRQPLLGNKLGNWYQNGFKVGPEYKKPCAPVASDWIDGYDKRVQNDLPQYAQWWAVFNDPILAGLIAQTYAGNLSLRTAGMRILQARASRGIAAGDLFPQSQQFSADYIHTQQSRTVLGGDGIGLGKRGFDFWSSGFGMAWELDVWGKFRRQIESSDAALDATIEDYDDILGTTVCRSRSGGRSMKFCKFRSEASRLLHWLSRCPPRGVPDCRTSLKFRLLLDLNMIKLT